MATPRLCSIRDCGKPAQARGLCRTHYAFARRHGEFINKPIRPYRTRGACRFEGCTRSGALKRGYCDPHYKRLWRHGDPAAGGTGMGVRLAWLKAHVHHKGDACLIWPFPGNANGYGSLTFEGKGSPASRVMCKLAHGDPPTPKHEAAHNCGRGATGCVHPGHLRWATSKENVADRIKHLAEPRGENCHSARLTRVEVREIRRLASTATHAALAEKFGVTRSNITAIINRKSWAWI